MATMRRTHHQEESPKPFAPLPGCDDPEGLVTVIEVDAVAEWPPLSVTFTVTENVPVEDGTHRSVGESALVQFEGSPE